jgi:signal transduction histidine kinase
MRRVLRYCDAMRSLRSRLVVLWALSLAASLAVGLLLLQLYRVSSGAAAERAEAALHQGCEAIAEAYGYFATGWAGPPAGAPDGGVDARLRRDLGQVVDQALAPFGDLQGGLWQAQAGLIGAPAAPWRAAVAALATRAGRDDQAESQAIGSGDTTVLLRACPLTGPIDGLVGWTLARVAAAPGYRQLRLGVGVLLALVLLSSLWLTLMIAGYARRIGAIEAALAGHEAETGHDAAGGDLPQIALTGERDLDRVVAALNRAGASLAQARARGAALAARVAQAERLAALGRVAAGMAHEIRNPIAAMRLRAENALAVEAESGRARTALQAILAQVARLDRLIAELLEMTRAREPAPAPTDLAALLRGCAAELDESGTRIAVESPERVVMLDSALLRRALDNLVQNALRHAPAGGVVRVVAELAGGRLLIRVRDDGAGVPEALRSQLFEPFVSGHADGTGLGLAIAREMAHAQGGTLALTSPEHPTEFTLDLPMLDLPTPDQPGGDEWPAS